MSLDNLLTIVAYQLREKGVCVKDDMSTILEVPVSYGEYSNLILIVNALREKVNVRLNCGEREVYDRIYELGKGRNLDIYPFITHGTYCDDKKDFYYPQLSFDYNLDLEKSAREICECTLGFIDIYKQVMKELQKNKKNF